MELELKHISHYLIHNLHVINSVNKEVELTISDLNFRFKTGFKPLLVPFSYFKDWIIKDIKEYLQLNYNQCMELLGFMDGEIKLNNISLGLYEKMCEKHIDFNKLIEKDLATIKQ